MTNEEVAVKLTEHENAIGSLKHRVKDLEDQNKILHELTLSVQELAMNIETMVRDQEKYSKTQVRIFQRLEKLEQKPAKHWDTVITVLITALVSGVVSVIMANVF